MIKIFQYIFEAIVCSVRVGNLRIAFCVSVHQMILNCTTADLVTGSVHYSDSIRADSINYDDLT